MGEERLHPALASSDEHGAEHDARSGRNTAAGEEFTTTPGASEYQDQEEKQGHVAREAKRKEYGAPSPEYDQLPGRRPRGGGRSPSFKRQSKKPRRGSFHKKNKKVKQNTG